MAHVHRLPNGEQSGKDLKAPDGKGHYHDLPDGEITGTAKEGRGHVHTVPFSNKKTGAPLVPGNKVAMP